MRIACFEGFSCFSAPHGGAGIEAGGADGGKAGFQGAARRALSLPPASTESATDRPMPAVTGP